MFHFPTKWQEKVNRQSKKKKDRTENKQTRNDEMADKLSNV